MTDKPNDVRVSRELLNTACNGLVQEQAHALNQLRALLAQPADQQGEPLMIGTLHRDCDERIVFESSGEIHIKDGMEVFAQPATAKVDDQEEFESWFLANVESDEGLTLERSAARPDQYELDETAQIYRGWQARAKLNTPQ